MTGGNTVKDKAFAFAVRVVRLNRYLTEQKREFVISKQLLRCGTSIGANIVEANDAYSRSDFLNKMYIALKECSESRYWIELLYTTDYLTEAQFQSLMTDCQEIQKLLTTITRSTKGNMGTDRGH